MLMRRCFGGVDGGGTGDAASLSSGGGFDKLVVADGVRRFVFVSGKGGVGKTTTASAFAAGLARSGRKTLVVSTDPAHSLGDALALDLGGLPQQVDLKDLGGCDGTLHAMEINAAEAVETFRHNLKLDRLQAALREGRAGLGTSFLNALAKANVDMEALAALLELSPPGIDEAVALGQMMYLLRDEAYGDFERIVIDTAPTGHTIRLLSFPQFLHGFLAAILSIQEKVSNFTPFSKVVGSFVGEDLHRQMHNTKASLEVLIDRMNSLNTILMSQDTTSFIVVCLPTHLAVEESRRLFRSLDESGMPARHVIMNQCPFLNTDGSWVDIAMAKAAVEKLERGRDNLDVSSTEVAALSRAVLRLQRQHHDAYVQIEALQKEADERGLRVLHVPTFEEELTGVKALGRYADILFNT